MPKITVHGGPSNADEPIERPGEGVFFQEAPDGAEGKEVRPSVGTSSSTSSPKTEQSSDSSETARPKPARTTGSRSKADQEDNSTAPAATSSGRETATR